MFFPLSPLLTSPQACCPLRRLYSVASVAAALNLVLSTLLTDLVWPKLGSENPHQTPTFTPCCAGVSARGLLEHSLLLT